MTLHEAINILQKHQDWRLGKHNEPTAPKELTEALEMAIRMMTQLN